MIHTLHTLLHTLYSRHFSMIRQNKYIQDLQFSVTVEAAMLIMYLCKCAFSYFAQVVFLCYLYNVFQAPVLSASQAGETAF